MKSWKENNLLKEKLGRDLFNDNIYYGDLDHDYDAQIELSNQGFKYAVIYSFNFDYNPKFSEGGFYPLKDQSWKLFKDKDEAEEFAKTVDAPYGGKAIDSGWRFKLYTQKDKEEREKRESDYEVYAQQRKDRSEANLKAKADSMGLSVEDYKKYRNAKTQITKTTNELSSFEDYYKKHVASLRSRIQKYTDEMNSIYKG